MQTEQCSRKHALVTGANSGIGRATVNALVAQGWHVFAGLHHADHAGDAFDEQCVITLTIDVTDENHLVSAVKSVSEHVGDSGLDALVDNAGVGVAGPLELIPLDRLRSQLEINVVGQVAVTQNFLPLLRLATGRIVFISSIGDRMALPFAGPLTASKAALSMIAHSWRQELAPWGIRVCIVAPALIHTDAADKLQRDADALVDLFSEDGRARYATTFSTMIKHAVKQEKGGSPPSAVADAVVKQLLARRPAPRVVVGKGGRAMSMLITLPIPMLDRLRRKLFALPAPGSARR
ncbi:MAG: SDR family NAD(P)-dependent oxidoreductase [Actinomycetota bacterium]|nr:SDR family NAD(P)-dependent oxidoreductase [Actinomycetota bacterium]MDQ2957174.1 SDR family NAD(P)-dependent oxidoreductase [Actinomycetota bacterium]